MAEAGAVDIRGDAHALAALLRRWLASGSLQSPAGAYCAWRDAEDGSLAFEYPEITGYALTWLAGRPRLEDQELRAGRHAADWLTDRLASGERSARAAWDRGTVYTFDLGMIASGLISFGRRIEESRYVAQGTSLAAELAGFVDHDGGLPAIAPGSPPSSRNGGWSTAGRPHLVKCVQALLLAGEDEAARLLAEHTAVSIEDDGHFVTQPGDDHVMLHPHLYAVEGLWMWGVARDDDSALDAARRATVWAWRHQLPSGGLPRWVRDRETGPEQADVTSQAIRAAILLGVAGPEVKDAIARIMEIARPDGASGSALVYAPESADAHLNAWVTMFGAQALSLVSDGPGVLDWEKLV